MKRLVFLGYECLFMVSFVIFVKNEMIWHVMQWYGMSCYKIGGNFPPFIEDFQLFYTLKVCFTVLITLHFQ